MGKTINYFYSYGKKKVQDYIKTLKEEYLYHLHCIDCFNSKLFYEGDDYLYFEKDIETSRKFVRVWEIMNKELPAVDKNLLLAYGACHKDYNETLKIFNGIRKNDGLVKNKTNLASLRMAVCRARKKVIDKYKEKYGNI